MATSNTISDGRDDNRARRLFSAYALAVGATVYAISFLLPAIKFQTFATNEVAGWKCAWLALAMPFSLIAPVAGGNSGDGLFSLMLFACGLINPLTLAYLSMRAWDRNRRRRRLVASIALGLIPLNWIFMAHGGFVPSIGHFAWIAGLLLMMGPEAVWG